MIEIVVTNLDRQRGRLRGIAQARDGTVTIFAERINLDSAKDRRQFAEEVLRRAPEAALDVERIDLALLSVVDEAAAEAAEATGKKGDGLGALLELLKGESPRELLIKLGREAAYFHTSDDEPYADIPIQGHRETWALSSTAFKTWLKRRFYEQTKEAPRADAIRDAIGVLEGDALFGGPKRQVYTRVAELGGAVYLDLADDAWQAVEITPNGWKVVSEPPVRFRRPKGMLPLPEPVRGGSLDELRRFVNVRNDDWLLLLSWLVMTLAPDRPYPILLLYGQQGSAKSTVSRILRSVVDPNQAPVRSRPRDEVDLLIAARGGSVVAFDNLSSLSDDLSDALCRLATGGGVGKRMLYTNAEETILDAMRPTIINGIEDLARRGDLADRGIALDLPPIRSRTRRAASTLRRAFAKAHPAILGALLDVVADALLREPSIHLSALPRMADFAVWAAAAAPALGWTANEFLAAYDSNRRERDQTVLDDSPLTKFLVQLVNEETDWAGTMSELLDEIKDRADDRALKDKRWPKDATRLSGMLRRLAPSLHAVGIGLETFREPGGDRVRRVRLWRMSPSDDPDQPEPNEESEGRGDAASQASQDHADQEGPGRDASAVHSVPPSVPPRQPAERDTPRDAARDAGRAHSVPRQNAALPDRDGAVRDARDARDAENQLLPEIAAGDDAHAGSGGPAPDCTYAVLTDEEAVRAVLPDLLAAPVLGLDTETTGLDPRQHRVRLVQLALPVERVSIVDLFAVPASVLLPLFDPASGPVLVGHNLKFDLQFLAAAGLPIPNGTRLFCTMLGSQVLEAAATSRPKGFFSLAGEVSRYLGITVAKEQQTSDWSGQLSDAQLNYAARDAAVLLPLHAALSERLAGAELDRVTRLEMRALPALAWVEETGAPFDAEQWVTLAEQATRRLVEAEQRLAAAVDRPDLFGDTVINWNSTPQVKALLAERGHTVRDVNEETLVRLLDVEPLARLLLDHREAAKKAGTYGMAFLEHLSPATGRVHANWLQAGSEAGRMACSRPNLQQVPRDHAYRACFRPADGRVLVRADFSQIELRLAAQIAHDRCLIEAFVRGEDVHSLTAAEVIGRTNGSVSAADRQAAKAINFGLLYGMGPATLKAHAQASFGVSLDDAQAARFRSRFFELYPGLKGWHRSQPGADRPVDTRTLAGRRRLGVSTFTTQLNTPVQGTGADGLKAALALLWETRERCPGAAPVLVVHDEIVVECDRADAERVRDWLTDCMTRGMAAFLTEVPVVVDAAIARDWCGTPVTDDVPGIT